MALFFSLLPVYLFGNLHCLGMCGPLVMLLAQHPYRYAYFCGRLVSYSLAGLLAGTAGEVLNVLLKEFKFAETLAILLSLGMIFWGFSCLFHRTFFSPLKSSRLIKKLNEFVSKLILKGTPQSTFLFGVLTVALPCGQTLVVFSACALLGDPLVGLFNGFALALLTSPSLLVALHAFGFIQQFKGYADAAIGVSAILVGGIALMRGLAELGWIAHYVLNPLSETQYHIVIY